MSDATREHEQLARHYGAMYDEELLQLAADYNNLTEIAREVLRAELRHRKLTEPVLAAAQSEIATSVEEPTSLGMDLTADGNVLIGNFTSNEEAAIAYWALEMAEIPSKVVPSSATQTNPPRLQVLPEDVGRAQKVLALPIADEVLLQYEAAKEAGDFQAPDCPVCGTPDPLLESADPTNEWFCESCGHHWKDA